MKIEFLPVIICSSSNIHLYNLLWIVIQYALLYSTLDVMLPQALAEKYCCCLETLFKIVKGEEDLNLAVCEYHHARNNGSHEDMENIKTLSVRYVIKADFEVLSFSSQNLSLQVFLKFVNKMGKIRHKRSS